MGFTESGRCGGILAIEQTLTQSPRFLPTTDLSHLPQLEYSVPYYAYQLRQARQTQQVGIYSHLPLS